MTDEFVEPVVCDPDGCIADGDSVIFMNFRPDRAREMTWALTGNLPEDAAMDTAPLHLSYVCTAQYDEALTLPVAFPPERIENTLGDYLSALGLTQLRIAETEKYAHVTFFFNGGVERPCPGEDRVLIPSPKQFPTYDLIPEMSAREVAAACCERIRSGDYDVVICNLANCDMVGTPACATRSSKPSRRWTIASVASSPAARETGRDRLITPTTQRRLYPDAGGQPHTAHTTNPVPFLCRRPTCACIPAASPTSPRRCWSWRVWRSRRK